MKVKLLVFESRIKAFMKTQQLRVSAKFYSSLNEDLNSLLLKAAERAKANGRSTILAQDL